MAHISYAGARRRIAIKRIFYRKNVRIRIISSFLVFIMSASVLSYTIGFRAGYIFGQEIPDPIDDGITEPRAKVNATYARGDAWSVKYQDGSYTWRSEPMLIWNGSRYAPYIFEDRYASDGYYQVQVGRIGIQIYDYYSKMYSPDMSEVRLYDERFEVQSWRPQGQGRWDDIGAQSGAATFTITQDSESMNITRSFTSWAGVLNVT